MNYGLDVIIVDDDPVVCTFLAKNIEQFYTWGSVKIFSKSDEAIDYCMASDSGIAVFVVDVFLDGKSGFYFLDSIEKKFPGAHQDAIMITANADDDVVNMCVASNVYYLLEKPVKQYALQLAIRSIVTKYITFSKQLLEDPDFARIVQKMG